MIPIVADLVAQISVSPAEGMEQLDKVGDALESASMSGMLGLGSGGLLLTKHMYSTKGREEEQIDYPMERN